MHSTLSLATGLQFKVLIKIELVAICGSDIALYQWNEVAKVIATVPFIPGRSNFLN